MWSAVGFGSGSSIMVIVLEEKELARTGESRKIIGIKVFDSFDQKSVMMMMHIDHGVLFVDQRVLK